MRRDPEPEEYRGYMITPLRVWHGGKENQLRFFVDGAKFNPDGYPTLTGARARITKVTNTQNRGVKLGNNDEGV